jgi:serine/threonine protein kinase
MPDMQAGARIGPYRVESVLPGSRGGFAQVVVARRISGGSEHETVAVKIARTDSAAGVDAEAFSRALGTEVETLRMLNHPGIVRLFPIQLDDRRYSYMARADNLPGHPWYYVMEYLAGGTAEDLVRNGRALDPALAVEITHQVGVALDYLHTSGYAHLDIKTNNIVFRRPLVPDMLPEAVLIDFGAAQKALRRAEVEAGALMYLPPERVAVLVGRRPPETVVNKSAADVYALGITLYRMLTGDLPFRGKRDHVTTAILNEAPTHPMQINRQLVSLPELDALIMQMLEKDPQRRPNIKEVLTRLDQAVAPPRFDGAVHVKVTKPAAGRGWKYAALALGVVVILEGAGLASWRLWSERLGIPTPITVDTPTQAPAPVSPTDMSIPEVATTPVKNAPPPKVAPTKPPPPTREPSATPATTNTPSGPEPTLVPTRTPVPTKPPTPRPTATPASPTPPPTPGSKP